MPADRVARGAVFAQPNAALAAVEIFGGRRARGVLIVRAIAVVGILVRVVAVVGLIRVRIAVRRRGTQVRPCFPAQGLATFAVARAILDAGDRRPTRDLLSADSRCAPMAPDLRKFPTTHEPLNYWIRAYVDAFERNLNSTTAPRGPAFTASILETRVLTLDP